MSVIMNPPDEVIIACDGCEIELIKFAKNNISLGEALGFADQYKDPIFCKKCSRIPEKHEIPEVLH